MSPQISSPPQASSDVPELAVSPFGKFAYFVLIASVVVLGATGIGTFALGRAPMNHWVLMAHVSAAPVFAMSLALVSLTWSDRCRFGCPRARQSAITKALLWFILGCGLLVILTGVVPMMPLFGTSGQHLLYLTHRYSGITLAGLVVLHLVNLFRGR